MKQIDLKKNAGGQPAHPRNPDQQQTTCPDDTSAPTADQAEPAEYSGPPWPEPMGLAAFHGIAGQFIDLVAPQSEADPAALLVQFLVAFGNAAGRTAHWEAEGTPHFTNENAVIVGNSSESRKGTSWGRVRAVFASADPAWESRTKSGLTSGEGLIYAVRDPRKDENGDGTGDDLGVTDKRLLVVEGEFAQVLSAAGRKECTLSPTVRNAWDGARLTTLVKNSGKGADVATGAHVSILGHITKFELKARLSGCDALNGFGNRFLWIAARRARLLPEGGSIPTSKTESLAGDIALSLAHTRLRSFVGLTDDATARWHEVYGDLTKAPDGVFGSMVARGPAHVRRLALIFAMLARQTVVDVDHLEAALAVWRYAHASAEHLFGGASPIAKSVHAELRLAFPAWVPRQDLHRVLSGHAKSEDLTAALGELARYGLATSKKEKTGGRPFELWQAK